MRRKITAVLLLLALLAGSNVGCGGKYANPSATLSRISGEVLLMKAGTGNWVTASSGTVARYNTMFSVPVDVVAEPVTVL